MNFDVTFDKAPWEEALEGLARGEKVSAARFLTLLEGEDDDTLEDAFRYLEEGENALDLSDLPKAGASGEAALRLREEEQLVQKGCLVQNLDANDPLRLYLEELAAIPACGDVQLLAQELARGKDVQAQLVNLSLGRVVELAREYVGRGVLLMDLIQEGSLGLWQGILNYDGGDFEALRDWWVRQYMARAVVTQARSSGLGQKMRQAVEDYREVDERLLSELGRNATIAEIAEQLHMSVEETDSVRKFLENARLVGKAHAQPEPEEEAPEEEQAVEDTAYYQTRERVSDLMSGLSELEMKLVNLRYGLDGSAPRTAAEVGRMLNMTVSEVVDLETAALAKMRQSGE